MIRILIADPHAASRKALALLLRRRLEQVELVEAGDVEKLIRILADAPPDLLLLDWKLYGSPAPETCRLLQKAYRKLKIVLLSVDPDDAAAARSVGAVFVYKGASPDELLAALKPLLEQKKTSRPKSRTGRPKRKS